MDKLQKENLVDILSLLNFGGNESHLYLLKKIKELVNISKGEKGDKGDKGERGEDGLDGKDGEPGRDGMDGRDGKDGLNGKDGADGHDADEDKICEKVSETIVEPITERVSQNLPSLGAFIRDGLELLQGDERLVIEAIKGLREELDELRELRSRTVGGGGFSYMAMDQHIFDNQPLVGTIDGVNTVFSLPATPSPISSLKIYRGGARQKIDVDFTLNGINVTFFVPPVVGEELLCDLRH